MMARIGKVTLELKPITWDSDQLEIVVLEQLRTARIREVCRVQCGTQVHAEDMELVTQIVEDVFLSLVGRTIGVADRLVF